MTPASRRASAPLGKLTSTYVNNAEQPVIYLPPESLEDTPSLQSLSTMSNGANNVTLMSNGASNVAMITVPRSLKQG